MDAQAVPPTSLATFRTNDGGENQAVPKTQNTLQTPARSRLARLFGSYLTPNTNTMTINSLPTPQLSGAYTPSVASADAFTETPPHRPEVLPDPSPTTGGALRLAWDLDHQLNFALAPELSESSGDSVKIPGSFPRKKRSPLPITIPEPIPAPTLQSSNPFAGQKSPALSRRSSPPRSAPPPSAFRQQFPSPRSARRSSPRPSPRVSPPQRLPSSPVPSFRDVELEHPRPVRLVAMNAVDNAEAIQNLLADLPLHSPARSQAAEPGDPFLPSPFQTSLHSAGLAVPSPFSASPSLGHAHASPASLSMYTQLGPVTGEVSSIPFPTEDDPPVPRRERPTVTRGRTIGRGRPNAVPNEPSTPLRSPNFALFPPTPFLGTSPLPSTALLEPLPVSPAIDSFLDLSHSSPGAPAITSAPLTEAQREDHRVRWQALTDRRARSKSPSASVGHQALQLDTEWDDPSLHKHGLFGSAAPPPSPERESSGNFYQYVWDRDACESPDRVSGYESPPQERKIVSGNEKAWIKGEFVAASELSEYQNPPSVGRVVQEVKEGSKNSGDSGKTTGEKRRQARGKEWFVGTLLGRMGDIHSRMQQVDMRLQNVETLAAQPIVVRPPAQPEAPATVEAPFNPVHDYCCVRLEHIGTHFARLGDDGTPQFMNFNYTWPQLTELTARLGRDFWWGGAESFDGMENRYMPSVKVIRFHSRKGLSVAVDCRGMLSSPDPVRFVIVEEVLDFMRQMLNAVVKLHTKGVYHGGICSPNICVYGTQMLQRKYLLLPCLRDPEQTVEIGQGHDMYFLGQVFIDVIDQSSVFHVFDDLVDWMTGIGKPQQISAEEALRRFEEVVKREEILQNSYMTIFRPERMPDHSMPMESEPQEEPELELELEPLLETAPELVNVSKEEVNGAECASVSLEDSEPTPIALIPPASRSESAESADGNPNTSESSEVVVVDNTLFEMSPVSAKPMDLPPLPPRRRGIATATRKAWGKIKRWFTPRW